MSSCNTKNMANNIDKSKNLILHFCLLHAARFHVSRHRRADDVEPFLIGKYPIDYFIEQRLFRQPQQLPAK